MPEALRPGTYSDHGDVAHGSPSTYEVGSTLNVHGNAITPRR